MKKSLLLCLLAAGAIIALLLWRRTDAPTASAPAIKAPAPVVGAPSVLPPVVQPAEPPPPAAAPPRVTAAQPAAVVPAPPLAPGMVPIRDQKTLDFSSGKAVVQNDDENKAALDKALKEMEEATRGVTFGPNGAAPIVK